MPTIDDLNSSYLNWLKKQIKFREIKNAIEITTPLMDRHNDFLQVYAVPDESGNSLRLTDDSYIISDLEMSGVDLTKKRKELLSVILNRHGVLLSDDLEIYVDTNAEDFPKKMHMLIQAMMAANDMFLTSRANVGSIFLEEIETFFMEKKIIHVKDVNFTGKSGLNHNFDFILPMQGEQPERLVKAFNIPTRQNAEILLFSWEDTKANRKKDARLYTFLNDVDRSISKDVISALNKYEVKPILWSQREEYLNELSFIA